MQAPESWKTPSNVSILSLGPIIKPLPYVLISGSEADSGEQREMDRDGEREGEGERERERERRKERQRDRREVRKQ